MLILCNLSILNDSLSMLRYISQGISCPGDIYNYAYKYNPTNAMEIGIMHATPSRPFIDTARLLRLPARANPEQRRSKAKVHQQMLTQAPSHTI